MGFLPEGKVSMPSGWCFVYLFDLIFGDGGVGRLAPITCLPLPLLYLEWVKRGDVLCPLNEIWLASHLQMLEGGCYPGCSNGISAAASVRGGSSGAVGCSSRGGGITGGDKEKKG